MSVPFSSVPSNLLVPFVGAEFDNTSAEQGAARLTYKVLLTGQMTSAGTAVANTRYRVTSADEVATYAGRGSQLHLMAKAYFYKTKSVETWILPVADNGAGTAASGKIVFAGTATADGTVSLYIGGQLVDVAVASGDTAADVAAALEARMAETDLADLPVTGAVDGSVDEEVDFTHRHKGTVGNELDIRLNYQDGEALPAGITATITAMASGATNPSLTSAITAMGDVWFHVIAFGWNDATSLTAIENELADRFLSPRQIDGVAVTAKRDSYANLGTLGDSRNSPHLAIVGVYQLPTSPCEVAAAAVGEIAKSATNDPARPLHTLSLDYVLPPAEGSELTLTERNLLAHDGISTLKIADGGKVQLEAMVTTYHTNAAGAVDSSYRYVTTMLNLMYLRYSFVVMVQTKYPRHKLKDDGAPVAPGSPIVTPKSMKADCLHWFKQMEAIGLVEDFESFKTNLVVERNEQDVNRLDILLPPNVINMLLVTAVNFQFRL